MRISGVLLPSAANGRQRFSSIIIRTHAAPFKKKNTICETITSLEHIAPSDLPPLFHFEYLWLGGWVYFFKQIYSFSEIYEILHSNVKKNKKITGYRRVRQLVKYWMTKKHYSRAYTFFAAGSIWFDFVDQLSIERQLKPNW